MKAAAVAKYKEPVDPTTLLVQLFDPERRLVCSRNVATGRCDVKSDGDLRLSASLHECLARFPALKAMAELDYCGRAWALSY